MKVYHLASGHSVIVTCIHLHCDGVSYWCSEFANHSHCLVSWCYTSRCLFSVRVFHTQLNMELAIRNIKKNDIVFAKVTGYPSWPATVKDLNSNYATVEFFSDKREM